MYEVCGEKELKVVLALDPEDSISGVARKIDENRETIRRVVHRLEEAGYVAYDDGLHLVDQGNPRRRSRVPDGVSKHLAAIHSAEAYVLPQFASMDYAFTSIDAVYVWTRGGYQVARDPEDYPLFIAVHESDLDAWTAFFDRFGILTSEERQPATDFDGAIQVVLELRPQIEAEMVDGRPVIPPKKRRRSQTSTTRTSSRRSTCSAACTTASTLTRITVQTDFGILTRNVFDRVAWPLFIVALRERRRTKVSNSSNLSRRIRRSHTGTAS